MGNIIVLGWGSLIWRAGELRTGGDWALDGPILPIEFSRISDNGRLTLVIDETNGASVRSRWIKSECPTIDEAIGNLQRREGSPNAKAVGYVDLRKGSYSPTALKRHKNTTDIIASWGQSKSFDAVIWTAIGPKWPLDSEFSIEAAAQYAASLIEPLRSEAHEYIRKAPVEVATPVRKRFEELMGSIS